MIKALRRYFNWIERLSDKKIDATGLAVFRMVYCAVLFCEVCQIIFFHQLIYDKVPYLIPGEINVMPGLIVWVLSIVLVFFGWFTRPAAIVNYILTLMFVGTLRSYEYHVFYTYLIVNFLFIFLNISEKHSIDHLIKTVKTGKKSEGTVSVYQYYLIIILGVGFVYFDSIFYKLASYNWMSGLGMWLPASLPMATHLDASFFLNQKWLAIGLGYLTIVFESVFLFTFFRKKLRIPLLIIGAGLHLGIILIFPIPWFGLSVLGLYLLLIPVGYWSRIKSLFRKKRPDLTIYYDDQCIVCNRTKSFIDFFDIRGSLSWFEIGRESRKEKKEKFLHSLHAVGDEEYVGVSAYRQIFKRLPTLYLFFILLSIPGFKQIGSAIYHRVAGSRRSVCQGDQCTIQPISEEVPSIFAHWHLRLGGLVFLVLCVFQLNVTLNSKLILDAVDQANLTESKVYQSFLKVSKPVVGASRIFFGISQHGVFMDGHFDDYNHLLALEAELKSGQKIWLPIIKKDGTADLYAYSFNWVKWTFRIMDNHVNQERLELGIRDFFTFWCFKNSLDIKTTKVNVYVRPLEIPKEWSYDFLRKQKNQEWKLVGQGKWVGDEFDLNIPVIEELE